MVLMYFYTHINCGTESCKQDNDIVGQCINAVNGSYVDNTPELCVGRDERGLGLTPNFMLKFSP